MYLRMVLAKLQKQKLQNMGGLSENPQASELKKPKAKREIEERLLPEKVSCPNIAESSSYRAIHSSSEISLYSSAGYGQSSGLDVCRALKAVPAE